MLIVGKKPLPAKDLKELIAWLKANPDKASIGTGGVGTGPRMSSRSISRAKSAPSFQFVPYRGTGPALQDLVAGQIDCHRRPGIQRAAAGAGRQHPCLCHHRHQALGRGAGHSDHRRGRPAGLPRVAVVGAVGAERARRRMSSPSSTPRSSRRWPIRRCASASPRTSVSRSRRSRSRRRRRCARTRRPRSTNGGRSSRRPTSRRNDGAGWRR